MAGALLKTLIGPLFNDFAGIPQMTAELA